MCMAESRILNSAVTYVNHHRHVYSSYGIHMILGKGYLSTEQYHAEVAKYLFLYYIKAEKEGIDCFGNIRGPLNILFLIVICP